MIICQPNIIWHLSGDKLPNKYFSYIYHSIERITRDLFHILPHDNWLKNYILAIIIGQIPEKLSTWRFV